MFGMISNRALLEEVEALRALVITQAETNRAEIRHMRRVIDQALANVAGDLGKLKSEVRTMGTQIDDELQALKTALAEIKSTADAGIAKVLALLASIDLSEAETAAQEVLGKAQETLTGLQAAFAGLPEPPAPPTE